MVLVVPALIFIFLRLFGENKFDVPVQHPDGLNIPGCQKQNAPHQVPAIDSLGLDQPVYHLIYVQGEPVDRYKLNELKRISLNNPDVSLLLFFYNEPSASLAENYREQNWNIFIMENEQLEELNRCGFGNITKHPLIFTDPEQHIRGYYDIDRKKELDRLEGEIKILME